MITLIQQGLGLRPREQRALLSGRCEFFVSRGLCGWYISRFGSSVSQFASCVSQFGMVCLNSYVIWMNCTADSACPAYESSQYIRCWYICFEFRNGWCVNVIRMVWMSCIHYGSCVEPDELLRIITYAFPYSSNWDTQCTNLKPNEMILAVRQNFLAC